MRVSGLASGMDTESIIRDMMKAQRIPLNKITQKKQYLEWQLDNYRAVNRKLNDFSTSTFNNMILSTSFTQKKVSVSAPDDVSIRNLSSTGDFSGTISVKQLAKNATLQSGEHQTYKNGIKITSSTKLGDLEDFDGQKIIKIQAINKEGQLDGVKELKFSETDTIGSILQRINSETSVTAFFDDSTGKIAMTAKNSGKVADENGAEIVLGGRLAEFLKLDATNATAARGGNAEFTLNGLEGMKRSSNTFQINGFEFSLKAANETNITFSSAPDTDKIYDSIVKYVEEYNKLIEDLNKQIREPIYRSFQPLSTEQKADMKEKEIEMWEEKAKSGTLKNDSMISSMLTKMRTALMDAVKGVGTLKDIGITTGGYQDNGKLIINEKALKEAINADPNKVHELFAKTGDTDGEKGFAQRLRGIVEGTRKEIAARAGSASSVNHQFTLGRNLINMDKQIESFESRLKQVENRYWKQFTAMEKAIQRANSQSAYLMNAFGGGMQ